MDKTELEWFPHGQKLTCDCTLCEAGRDKIEAAKVFGPIVCKHGRLIQLPCYACMEERIFAQFDQSIADQQRGEYSDERQRWRSDSSGT